uniref:hypothetical protein n=1 Tax=Scytothamnus australis TaxID=66621 RepID=UPI002E77F187|nr:hypothetical protein V2495_pgp012 [Scytothamnus australis]WAM64797.1 hypothetical protein [Scytothamnus australis]
MNHAIFIVKLIKDPVSINYENYQTVEAKVKFASPRQKSSINELTLLLWGEYRDDFLTYYKVHDYVIVEGILTLTDSKTNISEGKLIVKRLYPLLLN